MRMSCSMAQVARAPDEARGRRRSLRRFGLGLAFAGQLERLHSFDLWRPERDLLAVLPLDRDARGLADAPDGIVGLGELEVRGGADGARLLEDGHQLVRIRGAGLLDGFLEEVDRVVSRGCVGRGLVEAGLEGDRKSVV